MDLEALSFKLANAKKKETVSETVSTSIQNGDKNALATVLNQQKSKIETERVNSDNLANELAELSLILNKEDAEKANNKLKEARKQVKNVSGLRLEITRPIDAFKKTLVNVEKACNERLVAEIDRVNSSVNAFWAEVDRQAEIERRRIEAERLKKLEVERVKVAIEVQVENKLVEVANSYKKAVYNSLNTLSIENWNERTTKLKAVKPKLAEAHFNSLFQVPYNNRITKEEYKVIVDAIQRKTPYDSINQQYKNLVQPTIQEAINQLPTKLAELKQLAELEKKNKAEAERIRKEQAVKAEQERKQREAEELAAQKVRAAEQAKKEADAIIQAELEAQAKEQTVNTPSRKVKYVAELADDVDLMLLIKTAVYAEGYKSKKFLEVIQSMADYLANNSQYEIKGITYKPA